MHEWVVGVSGEECRDCQDTAHTAHVCAGVACQTWRSAHAVCLQWRCCCGCGCGWGFSGCWQAQLDLLPDCNPPPRPNSPLPLVQNGDSNVALLLLSLLLVLLRDINRTVWGVDLVEEHLLVSCGLPARPLIARRPLAHLAEYSINAPVTGGLGAQEPPLTVVCVVCLWWRVAAGQERL